METAYGKVGKRLVRFEFNKQARVVPMARVIMFSIYSFIGGFIFALAIEATRL